MNLEEEYGHLYHLAVEVLHWIRIERHIQSDQATVEITKLIDEMHAIAHDTPRFIPAGHVDTKDGHIVE